MRRKSFMKAAAFSMAAAMAITAAAPVYAKNGAVTSDAVTDREQKNSDTSEKLATQGMVLLQNKDNVLPLAKGSTVAVLGTGARQTVKGGTGSGDVNQRSVVNVVDGLKNADFKVNESSYLDAFDQAESEAEAANTSWFRTVRADEIELTDQMVAEAAEGTDTCIYVLARNAGEGADRTDTPGDYELSLTEKKNLNKITKTFDKVILVINAGGAIDTKYIRANEGIDSIIVMGQAGQRGGDALAEILDGDVTPSGHLGASWPENYTDLPLSGTWGNNDGNVDQEDYTDGIYVGYRFYDTFNVTPAYCFGYGLSYTTFDIKTDEVTADANNVNVKVTVTNTGDTYTGRQVVQVYFSAPDGEVEKPYQELAGFAKTDDLAPGESQTLTISFRTADMSSYVTAKAAYIMDPGDYIIRVGDSSRSTKAEAVIRLNQEVITEQLSNQLAQDKEIKELSKEGVEPYSYEGEADEIAAAPVIELDASSIETADHASPYDSEDVTTYVSDTTGTEYLNSNLGYTLTGKYHDHPDYKENVETLNGDFSQNTLKDVYDGKITMEEFVSGLTVSQMADIVIGGNKLPTANGQSAGAASENSANTSNEAMIGAQANAVAGAAGETAGIYIEDKKIPNIVLADGPAGLRITQEEERDDGQTYYQYCTAFPSGTVMTQTWDTEAMKTFGDAVGTELEEYGVTLLLAPGMNIQKDPLCGRNFEYYSEDPYLAGMMGISETTGVQSHPGIGVTIKHFYGNDQEDNRTRVNNTISERASREIYLKQFEMVVKGAQPMAIMSSYNLNNGIPDADDYDLLTNVTRGEWGFEGLVMTDWGGGQSTPSISMHAGNDLIMPGSSVEDITIRAFTDQEPTFAEDDIYPEVTVSQGWFGLNASAAWGEFVNDANGDVTIEKTVATSDYESATRPAVGENGEETTVPVKDLIAQLGDSVEVKEDGDNTVITYKGHYKDNNIALGDLQKSTANILKVVMASDQFASLFDDVEAKSWTESYADELVNYLTVTKE